MYLPRLSVTCSAGPGPLGAAPPERPGGAVCVLHLQDPRLPLHVLELRLSVPPPAARRGPAAPAALQPGKHGRPGTAGLLVHPPRQESEETLPAPEQSQE